MMSYEFMWVESRVGKLRLVATGDALAAILWEFDRPGRNRFDVKLDFKGTEFQKKVWAALLTIPYGETRTYGQIAKQIGHPSSVRAVGAANGRNPISIIAPCHRLIGAGGALTGFAGGLKAKEFLLKMESNGQQACD